LGVLRLTIVLAVATCVARGGVVELNAASLDGAIQDGAAWFLDLYSPRCGHCRDLEPAWTRLAEAVGQGVRVAKLDVVADLKVAKRFGVRAYPTLIMFADGYMYTYKGARDVHSLQMFAEAVARGQPPPSAAKALVPDWEGRTKDPRYKSWNALEQYLGMPMTDALIFGGASAAFTLGMMFYMLCPRGNVEDIARELVEDMDKRKALAKLLKAEAEAKTKAARPAEPAEQDEKEGEVEEQERQETENKKDR
jgi:thiol-disulfide isomerase/thioredoxin